MASAWLAGLLVFCLLWGPSRGSFAQGDDEAEYRVKLAFLYNFTQFIEWPPEAFHDAEAPLLICVAGQDPFPTEVEQGLRGRVVGGHAIEIRRLRANDNPKACHMVFIPAGERKMAERIAAGTKGSSTLTVGETEGFAEQGGMINLTLDRNKLRFEINLAAALQARLKMSSKLLALAKIVKLESSP